MSEISSGLHCLTLSGGAQAHLMQLAHLSQAHLSITVATGYLDEPSARPGLAHLLEHLLMTSPSAAARGDSLLGYVQRLPGHVNANTDDLVTDFHATVPTACLEKALLTLAQQLAYPQMRLDGIRAEIQAIDAEFKARRHSHEMSRLAALQALATPSHPAFFCHHGNASSLAGCPAGIRDALIDFHQLHYQRPRLTIALLSAYPLDVMRRLAADLVACFPPGDASCKGQWMPSRWGQSRISRASGACQAAEGLWPLESVRAGDGVALDAFVKHLDQGGLNHAIPADVSDYKVTLAPPGAGDALQVICRGGASGVGDGQWLSDALASQWRAFDPQGHDVATFNWQHSVSLASSWWGWNRQQALLRRCLVGDSTPSGQAFNAAQMRWIVYQADPLSSEPGSGSMAPTLTARGRSSRPLAASNSACTVKVRRGRHGVEEDFTALKAASWVACYLPQAAIMPPWLARQTLARQGITLCPSVSPRGGDMMLYHWPVARSVPFSRSETSSELLRCMTWILEQGRLLRPAVPGILARQLLQSLYDRPDHPVIWSSGAPSLATLADRHQTAAHAERQAVLALQHLHDQGQVGASATYQTQVPGGVQAEVAVMGLIALPASPEARLVAAFAERYQAGEFLEQIRFRRHLGYVAAIRCDDTADRVLLGYVVQSSTTGAQVLTQVLGEVMASLWDQTFRHLAQAERVAIEAFAHLPDTPAMALQQQWQQLLGGGGLPLHRVITAWPPSREELDCLRHQVMERQTWQFRYQVAP